MPDDVMSLVDSAYAEAMAGRLPQAVMINEDGLRQVPLDSVGLRCEFYSCLLYCYHRLGDYEQALHYGELCLQYDEQQGDKSNISASLGNLAGIYSSAGRHEVAIDYLNRAIRIEEELLQTDKNHTPKSLAVRKAMLGEVLLAKAKRQSQEQGFQDQRLLLEQALQLTDEALRIDRSLDRKVQVGMRLSQLANIYAALGDDVKARQYNLEALDTARKTNNRMTEVITLLQLGEYHEAADIAHELGMKKQEYEACHNLYLAEKNRGDADMALQWLERAEILQDSIRTEEAERQLTLWQVRYDTQRKEQQLLQHEQTIHHQHIRAVALSAIAALALVVAALLILLMVIQIRSKRFVQAAANAKDRFYAILSHDLKNPVVAQQQVLRMLYADFSSKTPDDVQKNIGSLLASSDSQLELIQNLQQLALLEQGSHHIKPVRLDLGSIAAEVDANMRGVASLKNITLSLKLGRTLVLADRDSIKTVLRNLISNAIKFSPNGSTVEIGTQPPNRLYVRDAGVGMTEEKRQELLNSTSAIPSSVGTAGEGGTGIGIALSRQLLNLCGGTLDIETEIGKGSVFILSLPSSATDYKLK